MTKPTPLIPIIRSLFGKESLPDSLFATFTHEDWQALYALAKKHDLAHLVGDVLLKHKLLPESEAELSKKFSTEAMAAVFRTQRIAGDLAKLRAVLNEAELPYIFLKGAVIRTWYPEPWMRTSCDIDVLVRTEDLERARTLLADKLAYVFDKNKGDHHADAFGPSKIHLELHFKLIEGDIQDISEALLADSWSYAAPTGSGSEYAFSDAFFYYYFLAHTVKHFVYGGCGVRPLIDLFIMRRALPDNAENRRALLEAGGLLTFSEKLEKLSRVWFEDGEHDEVTRRMEEYILNGGVYGTSDQHAVMSQVREGSAAKHILQRIWMPKRNLVTMYPVIEEHPILIPACQAARWGTRLFEGRGGKAIRELKMNASVTDSERDAMRGLLEELELK